MSTVNISCPWVLMPAGNFSARHKQRAQRQKFPIPSQWGFHGVSWMGWMSFSRLRDSVMDAAGDVAVRTGWSGAAPAPPCAVPVGVWGGDRVGSLLGWEGVWCLQGWRWPQEPRGLVSAGMEVAPGAPGFVPKWQQCRHLADTCRPFPTPLSDLQSP